eukprot:m51a1_g10524 hypothetical protein (184) ;mRNA; f:224229-225957
MLEILLERDLRGMPMLAVVGRLVPPGPGIDLDQQTDKLLEEHAVLAVSNGSRRGMRGVCGLGVAAARPPGSVQAAQVTWIYVAKNGYVELPSQLWCTAVGFTEHTRVVPENVKEAVFSAFRIPKRLVCPISFVVITNHVDAVMAPDGHVYERQAIVKWLEKGKRSPFTYEPMSVEDLIPYHPS